MESESSPKRQNDKKGATSMRSFPSDDDSDTSYQRMLVHPKKRVLPSSANEENETMPSLDHQLGRVSRSEQKKYREQKRRREVNEGLDDLLALLIEIEPSTKIGSDRVKIRKGEAKNPKTSAVSGDSENPLISRVDLITRTVKVLGRLHQENKQQRLLIQQLLSATGADCLSPYVPPGIRDIFQDLPFPHQQVPMIHPPFLPTVSTPHIQTPFTHLSSHFLNRGWTGAGNLASSSSNGAIAKQRSERSMQQQQNQHHHDRLLSSGITTEPTTGDINTTLVRLAPSLAVQQHILQQQLHQQQHQLVLLMAERHNQQEHRAQLQKEKEGQILFGAEDPSCEADKSNHVKPVRPQYNAKVSHLGNVDTSAFSDTIRALQDDLSDIDDVFEESAMKDNGSF